MDIVDVALYPSHVGQAYRLGVEHTRKMSKHVRTTWQRCCQVRLASSHLALCADARPGTASDNMAVVKSLTTGAYRQSLVEGNMRQSGWQFKELIPPARVVSFRSAMVCGFSPLLLSICVEPSPLCCTRLVFVGGSP